MATRVDFNIYHVPGAHHQYKVGQHTVDLNVTDDCSLTARCSSPNAVVVNCMTARDWTVGYFELVGEGDKEPETQRTPAKEAPIPCDLVEGREGPYDHGRPRHRSGPKHEWRFRTQRVDLPRVWREAREHAEYPVVLVSNRGDAGDQCLLLRDEDFARLSSAGQFNRSMVVGTIRHPVLSRTRGTDGTTDHYEVVRIMKFEDHLDSTNISQLAAAARDLREGATRAKVQVF